MSGANRNSGNQSANASSGRLPSLAAGTAARTTPFNEHDLLVDLLNGESDIQNTFGQAPARLEFVQEADNNWADYTGDNRSHGTKGNTDSGTSRFLNSLAGRVPNTILQAASSLRKRGSDEEMIDLTPGSNPFADPTQLSTSSRYVPMESNSVEGLQYPSKTPSSMLTPMNDLPPGMGQYEDFETIGWLKEIARDRVRHREIHKNKKASWSGWFWAYWDSGSGWMCALIIGVVTGLFAAGIDIGCSWLSDLKLGLCADAFWLNKEQCCWASNDTIGFDDDCEQWSPWSKLFIGKKPTGSHPDAYFVAYMLYILTGVGMSFLCVMLVKVFAPYACGSGIPEIKTILSGFVIRGYLGKWTLLIKSVGMMLVVSAGLSLGKEGPMVHVASCVGNVFAYFFPKYGKNEAKKREILSASAAAGVAVAFGAPIGGVLFSLEEASYYFPLKTMFRSFFCAMISANVLRIMNPFGTDHLVMFYVEYTSQWHVIELIPFAILGALGGLFGAAFIRFNILMCRLRKTTWLGSHPIREVLIITLITAVFSYPHPSLRISSSQLISNLVTQCGPGDNIPLCDYFVNMSDPSIMSFGSFPAGPGVYTSLWLLAVALIFKMVITVFTFGMKVPAGLFIPSMTVGAIMGRMLGIGVEQLAVTHRNAWLFKGLCKSSSACINPGLYAMVGAAACLGGVTRMTISLVVIMLELTGGLTYIIPLMVASMVSKWTGDRLTHGGIYDEHIKLNGYPYLSTEEEMTHTTLAGDVMRPRPNDSPIQVITQDSMLVGDLDNILTSSTFNGFPVVVSHESQFLVGFVSRSDLSWAIECTRRTGEGIVSASEVFFSDQLPTDGAPRPPHAPPRLHLRHIVDLSPVTVTDQTSMETVMDFFRKLGLRQILVTRNGRLLGIITKKDVLRHLLQLENQPPGSVAFS